MQVSGDILSWTETIQPTLTYTRDAGGKFWAFWSGIVKCFCGNAFVSMYIPMEYFCWRFMVYTCKTSASTSQRHLWSNSGRTPGLSWWDHAVSPSSKKPFHSEQSLLPQPEVYKYPSNKNHLPKNPSQTTQGNIHTTKTHENYVMLLQVLSSFKELKREKRMCNIILMTRDFHLVQQTPRPETTISGCWIAQWIIDKKNKKKENKKGR